MDRVLTVWDFYDGPRSGITEYGGCPYYFSCGWDSVADAYSNVFDLLPVDQATVSIALEQWSIWRTWESDFHAGRVTHDSHPAVGGKNARYDELEHLIDAVLSALPPASVQAVPEFIPATESSDLPPGVMRPLLVVWSNAA